MTLCIKTDLTKLFILNELLSHTLPVDFNAYGLEIGHLNHAVGGLLNNSFLDFKSLSFSVDIVFKFVSGDYWYSKYKSYLFHDTPSQNLILLITNVSSLEIFAC